MTPTRPSRTWQLWERPATPRPFRIQPRDVDILRLVYRYRFLRPQHVQAALGGSLKKIRNRMFLLWADHYLERPRALRPTRLLEQELVYSLARKGAQHLAHVDSRLRGIADRDWSEEPKKEWGAPYIDHELLVADFGIALEVACRRAGVPLYWTPHSRRSRYRLELPDGKRQRADAYFRLGDRQTGLHCFLEADRASVSLERMRERYANYFLWWRSQVRADTTRRLRLRVITLTTDPRYVASLRRVARDVGRDAQHPRAWRGLLFTHRASFELTHADHVLGPIFHYADEERPIALL